MTKLKFDELGLSKEVLKAVHDMGFEEATPIQSAAIPVLLAGGDVIGQAQTGTGKTAAFGIPALELLTADRKTQVLILCPTRELAIQVAEELIELAKYKKIQVLPVYGGQQIERQIRGLQAGAQVVIGTPGRVVDHIKRGTINFSSVKMVILDEADEMLDMGFRDDLEFILKETPKERQTVFFSATMPKSILDLTRKYQNNPEHVSIKHETLTVPLIEQEYFDVRDGQKLETLSRLIDLHGIKLGLVFCNTKRRVDEVVGHLQARGYSAEGLHGDLRQNQRDLVMGKFRKGTIELLVATDVAARGIDVDDVEAVFNYDVPQDEESYVHRIGRTGRAGRSGRAFSFVSGKDFYKLQDIQRYAKIKIKRGTIPSFADIEQSKAAMVMSGISAMIEEGGLEPYMAHIERLMDSGEFSPIEIAAAFLKIEISPDREEERIEESAPARKHTEANMVKLVINVGNRHNIRPKDILGAIAGETGVAGSLVGNIDVQSNLTFVEVATSSATRVINGMKKAMIRGNRIKIEEYKGR